jgi:hypothetical protein
MDQILMYQATVNKKMTWTLQISNLVYIMETEVVNVSSLRYYHIIAHDYVVSRDGESKHIRTMLHTTE